MGHIREPSWTPCPDRDPPLDADGFVTLISGGGGGDRGGTTYFLWGGSHGELTEPP
jgi:hypothetical protein